MLHVAICITRLELTHGAFGWVQDTTYFHNGRHYIKNCYIEGDVDFIFGNATTYFDECHIHCKSNGYVTAHKRGTESETTGFVFYK